MHPIFVECTIVDSGKLTGGHYYKNFLDIGEFNAWYKIAREDEGLVLNIMRYNPLEKPLLKSINDVKLLSVSRELAV